MNFFDAHCHLQDNRIVTNSRQIIDRAKECGIIGILCCGTAESDWKRVLELAERYQLIIPALGIHPWFVTERSNDWLRILTSYVKNNKAAVIGEIGLDHAVKTRNDEEQLTVFRQQLYLAHECKLPASVHCRKAWGMLLRLLREDPKLGEHIILHSYSGSPELVDELIDYDVYFSFSGSITYERNKRGRTAAIKVPSERLLVETDSPDILPENTNGNNTPENLPLIVQTIAQLKGVLVADIAHSTTKNAEKLFNHGKSTEVV
jgi:TatD DNase family protein